MSREVSGLPEMFKQRIATYSMKMRIYPSAEQAAKIDRIFRALHLAYNMTFHEVFLLNPAVCTDPKPDGVVWPDFRKMAKAEWKDHLISLNPAIAEAPAAAITTNNGLFLLDAKRAWEKGMHKRPVTPELRKDFRFYNAAKPRSSFLVQIPPSSLIPSTDNAKVAWITIPKVGRVKARGFNRRLCFGENGQHTYTEALDAGELPKQISMRVSKDNCGDYFISLTFSEGKKKDRFLYLETPAPETSVPVGIDMGIKDIAALSTGEKIENRHFKKEKHRTLTRLNRELSRRWGPANMAFRDYNKDIRSENRRNPEVEPIPTATPSKRYLAAKEKKARIERKITQQRNTYYHQQTAALIRKSSMIAIETLHVKNMLRNHKLAYALSDAAMSVFLGKLKYKAERKGIEVRCVGTFEPTSQLCNACAELYPQAKNLGVRAWTCPKCGARHDRDVNAAKNILQIALTRGSVPDKAEAHTERKQSPPAAPRRKRLGEIIPGKPEIAAVFSRELTRHNDPRYVIKNTKTGTILDDAQGVGYRSASNAKNCYKAKIKWASLPV